MRASRSATVRSSGSGLPRAVIDLAEYTSSQNWLVHGDTGSGKTPWCSLIPGMLIIGVDHDGIISAKAAISRHPELKPAPKLWEIHSWKDFEEAGKYLIHNPNRFPWVLVDTVTMLQTRLLRHILEAEFKRNPAKRRNTYIPEIQDHQMWQNMLKRWVMDLNELPVNVVWTAQSVEREDAEGDPVVWPLLPGGKKQYEMSAWLVAQMHVIGYLQVKQAKSERGRVQTVRTMLLDKQPPYVARDRFGVLPKKVTVMTDDREGVSFRQLTSKISAAPEATRVLAARRVAERDDSLGEPATTIRKPARASTVGTTTPPVRRRPTRKG